MEDQPVTNNPADQKTIHPATSSLATSKSLPASSAESMSSKPSQDPPQMIQGKKIEYREDDTKLEPDLDLKKKYCKISNEKRLELINAVENEGQNIKQVAKRLGINYSSAKSICQGSKKEVRTNKKVGQNRYVKEESKMEKNMINPEFPICDETQKRNAELISEQKTNGNGPSQQGLSKREPLVGSKNQTLENRQSSGFNLTKEGTQGQLESALSQAGSKSEFESRQLFNDQQNYQSYQDKQYNERQDLQKKHLEEQRQLSQQHQEQKQQLFDQQRLQQKNQHHRQQEQQQHLYQQQRQQQDSQQQQQQYYQTNQPPSSFYVVSSQPVNQAFQSYAPSQNWNSRSNEYSNNFNSGKQNSKNENSNNANAQNFYMSESSSTYSSSQNSYPQYSSSNTQQQHQGQSQMQPVMFLPMNGQPNYLMQQSYTVNNSYPFQPQQGGYFVMGSNQNFPQENNQYQKSQYNNETAKE